MELSRGGWDATNVSSTSNDESDSDSGFVHHTNVQVNIADDNSVKFETGYDVNDMASEGASESVSESVSEVASELASDTVKYLSDAASDMSDVEGARNQASREQPTLPSEPRRSNRNNRLPARFRTGDCHVTN